MTHFASIYKTGIGDPKPEKKIKVLKLYVFKKKPTGEKEVFEMLWNERPHKSQITGEPIHEAVPTNFLHVLAKGKNRYPKFKLLKENIIIGTDEDHHFWDHDRKTIEKMDSLG